MSALKAQRAARAACDTLAARQAVAIVNGQAAPRMAAHVNPDRAIVRADAALHATHGIGHDMAFGQGLVTFEVGK